MDSWFPILFTGLLLIIIISISIFKLALVELVAGPSGSLLCTFDMCSSFLEPLFSFSHKKSEAQFILSLSQPFSQGALVPSSRV